MKKNNLQKHIPMQQMPPVHFQKEEEKLRDQC